ncbi:hypothetical protein I6A84_29900 [Frankia sp. CNm7]|uniref:Uncharacterized protein n=1 Tax=Frankia nepalensis TaxID=1836974 RepID=A0A937REJ8_9ACTN|nr:hypothetical protein [Frankia nepalensis]MBL7498997.1 hypothetical protein [Frankia nepalensis]MBL7511821.1 hypothetical protein [Frankia nepalensis]MBL7522177.1 hypothetical protein [Frankia nepalensis]MBL7630726.1 hypothetical protein [Frankia nepalensis]
MTLVPVRGTDGLWYLSGVVADESTRAPLGRLYWKIGPHFLGVDDSFEEPVIARAYYDPTQDNTSKPVPSNAEFAGYMQFINIYFNGVSVRPEAYGGHVADRAFYAGPGNTFVDFMGPADAAARVDRQIRKLNPFYAYNGSLSSQFTTATQFATYPRTNGVLLFAYDGTNRSQARCASLVAELVPGLLTAKDVARQLTPDNRLRAVPCQPADIANDGAYHVALIDLQRTGDLPGLSYADLAGTVIGGYTLIELPDTEGINPFLCVYPNDSNTAVNVHLLAAHEIDSARQSAVMTSLLRMTQAIEDDEDNLTEVERGPRTRGVSGLDTLPFVVGKNTFTVEWRYTTYLMAQIRHVRTRRSNPLGDLYPMHGFTWSVCQKFYPDTRELLFTSISRPRDAGPFSHALALGLYDTLIDGFVDNPAGAPSIDVSNFILAGMNLRNLARGRKLAGLTVDGHRANGDDGAPI